MSEQHHSWNFSTVGGVKRVNLDSGKDLMALGQLDQKLWSALSCPVNGLEIDPKTLALIDTNKDEQIRVLDVLNAVEWVLSVIKNPDNLLQSSEIFPLSAINTETVEGKQLWDSAKIILKNLQKPEAETLTVEDTSDHTRIFAATAFNGDGIITEDSTTDHELLQALQDIITCLGGVNDRGGKPGINEEKTLTFFDACQKYSEWMHQAAQNAATIKPFGTETAIAYEAYMAIKQKVSDYFLRCRLAAFDPQATEVLNMLLAQLESISSKNLSTCMEEIATYPIAKVAAGKSLPLLVGINPAWEAQLASFKQLVVEPLHKGSESLSEPQWNHIVATFEPYITWLSQKAGVEVEVLGSERIDALLQGNTKDALLALITNDLELAEEANDIIRVDQLVRYYRDIYKLLKNFVTFYDFYSGEKAIFQAGTLYIDQRSCDLCIKVNDMAKHAAMASFSGMYLIYLDCVSRATAETMTIVVGLTNGDVDNMMVGRNALFYDRKGLDWDATIVKIIENPISIRQAFWSPYRKVARFIETQVNKFAASQDEKANANLTNNVSDLEGKVSDNNEAKAPLPPFDVGKFVGIFAAISLALGAIGSVLASFVSGFISLEWWQMPLAFAGIMLLISGPAMLLAFLKLRKRNLSPILDANGWAVNAGTIINISFGRTLTHLAQIPAGAVVNLNDPFKKKRNPWIRYLLLLALISGICMYYFFHDELMTLVNSVIG